MFICCFLEINSGKEDTPLLKEPIDHITNTEEAKKLGTWKSWKRLFSLAKPEWLILLIGTVALFAGSLIFLSIPAAGGVIVDAVVGEPSTQVRKENKLKFQLFYF